MKNETINVTMSTDDNYCGHMCALMKSILKNSNRKYNFYIFYTKKDLNESNRKLVSNLFSSYDCKISFKEIDGKIFEKSILNDEYISSATYFRLMSFNKINKDRVIYLDLDIIVMGDLGELYDSNLRGHTLGAVPDYILGLKDKKEYFNAGVLLIDLNKWKEENYTKKCLSYLQNNGHNLRYADQDILNEIFKGEWKSLPLKFNRQKIIWDYGPKTFGISKKEYDKLIKYPGIIHYTGPVKPWSFKYVFPDKKYYLKYLSKTPWREEVNKDISIKNILFFLARWIMYKLKIRDYVEGIIKFIKNAKK